MEPGKQWGRQNKKSLKMKRDSLVGTLSLTIIVIMPEGKRGGREHWGFETFGCLFVALFVVKNVDEDDAALLKCHRILAKTQDIRHFVDCSITLLER